MEVKIFKRKTNCSQLLAAITENTDLVKIQASDYDAEPIVKTLDFEDRILGNKDSILSDIKKVCGIVDLELFMKCHMYEIVKAGDIVEFSDHKFIKSDVGYVPVEIK